MLAAFALFACYDLLDGYGPHAAVGLGWAAFGLAVAGIYVRRPVSPAPWMFGAGAIALGCLADTALIAIGRPGDYLYAPIQLGYLFCYLTGVGAIVLIVRRWPASMLGTVALDAATLAAALLTALVSLGWPALIDPSRPLGLRVCAVVFPALDCILLVVLQRFWLSQQLRVAAVHVTMLSVLFLTVYHVIVLVDLAWPGWVHGRWHETWVLMFVTLAVGVSLPSLAQADLQLARLQRPEHQVQLASIAFSLALPYAVLVAYGVTGRTAPWQVAALGGFVISTLVTIRVAWLLARVQERARRGERLALVDALTGAPNRRHWDVALREAVDRVSATPQAPGFWVAMLDLDRFKQYNDAHGHPAGDVLLVEAVRAWQRQLPDGDLLTRFGGEEFALLLAGRDRAATTALLERVRHSTPGGQTCSVGVARWSHGHTAAQLMHEADQALYAAKRGGRDRVVFHDSVG